MKAETLFERLFFATVRIEVATRSGQLSCGTGFIYGIQVGPDRVIQLLVTNKHVIEDAGTVTLWFLAANDPERKQPKLGSMHRVDLTDADEFFVGHPDPDIDVAVGPISGIFEELKGKGRYCFFRNFNPALLLGDEDWEILDALERVTFIGYPNGLHDQANGLPIARQGMTATPISVDYGGEPVFLIDASVFPGSSGSPVMVADAGSFSVRGEGKVGERLILLGVLAATYQRDVPVLKTRTDGGAYVNDLLNLGIVYKARTIDEVADVVLSNNGFTRSPVQPKDSGDSSVPG